MSTSQWEAPRSVTSPITASPRWGMYRPFSGITLTRPSCSFRMPNCAAKSCPPSLYVPGPGFSPGPPTKPLRGEIQRSARPLVMGECLSMPRPGTPSGSDSLVRLQDPRLHVSFRLRVQPLQEVRLQARGHLDDAEPSSRRGPLLFQDRAVSLDVPVGFRAVFRAQLDRDPDLLEADRDEGPQRVEDLLHLLLDRLERVDVDLGLLHRVLDALGWMGSAGLRVDRVRRDVLDDLLALRLQHLPTLFRGQLNLAALDDLLRDGEGLRRPEELGHLVLRRLRALVGVLENLVNRELLQEVHVLAVTDLLDRLRLHEDLELLARLLDASDHVFLENIVASVAAEFFRHEVA